MEMVRQIGTSLRGGNRMFAKKVPCLLSRSLSSKECANDVLRNKGTVEGVWIFCRHGDRAPSRPLCPPHKIEEEANFWSSRLPRPGSFRTFQEFSRYFTPDIQDDSSEEEFLDTRRYPFGFLTHFGMEQTREIGKRLFRRYNSHGHHLPGQESYVNGKGFLDCWDVKVYSTNYLRTIMSIQSFLDGLLGTDCYKYLHNSSNGAASEAADKARIPNHNDAIPFDDTIVRVQVRGQSDDTLNAFDRNPELMSKLVSKVISSEEFQDTDKKAAPLAARLANFLPGLARKKKNTKGFNAAPSGINWIEATDHFVCRFSHNVKYSQFSDFEHDIGVEQTLSAMAHQTKAHLAWRFRQWYKSPMLLSTIAAPPLREIANQLLHAKSMGEIERHPFTIYSCHDVTILAILYGIGADFLAGDEAGGFRRFWPEYSSTLVRASSQNTYQSTTPSGN
eukprot:scaffold11076_cov122-Cylindrotheca_fusiformis.AAC.6